MKNAMRNENQIYHFRRDLTAIEIIVGIAFIALVVFHIAIGAPLMGVLLEAIALFIIWKAREVILLLITLSAF